MNTLLQNIRERTEQELAASESLITEELKDFEESLRWQLIGVRKLTEKDMKSVVDRTRHFLDTIEKDIVKRVKHVERTTEEMLEQHQLWGRQKRWKLILTPLWIGAMAVIIGAFAAFTIAPRQIEKRIEIQPPQNGLERSVRVMALGGAGTVLVLPEGVTQQPCPLMTPTDRLCVRTPRMEN